MMKYMKQVKNQREGPTSPNPLLETTFGPLFFKTNEDKLSMSGKLQLFGIYIIYIYIYLYIRVAPDIRYPAK